MGNRALVRRPSPRLAEGLLTHIARAPVDAELAMRQWEGYVAALAGEGWETIEVPPADDCPDAAFVEDTVVVYADIAVIARPGADERKPETAGTEQVLDRARLPDRAHRGARDPRRRRRAQARRHRLGGARRPHQPVGGRAAGGAAHAARRDRRRRTRQPGAAPEVRGDRAAGRLRDRLRAARGRPGHVGAVPARAGGAGRPRRTPRRGDRPHVHQRAAQPRAVRGARPAGRGHRHLRVREARGLRDLPVGAATPASAAGPAVGLGVRRAGRWRRTRPGRSPRVVRRETSSARARKSSVAPLPLARWDSQVRRIVQKSSLPTRWRSAWSAIAPRK